jgi:hypothetical protein
MFGKGKNGARFTSITVCIFLAPAIAEYAWLNFNNGPSLTYTNLQLSQALMFGLISGVVIGVRTPVRFKRSRRKCKKVYLVTSLSTQAKMLERMLH